MPTTRRRRVNPPESTEQNNPVAEAVEQAATPADASGTENKSTEATPASLPVAEDQHAVAGQRSTSSGAEQGQAAAEEKPESAPVTSFRHTPHTARTHHTPFTPVTPPATPVLSQSHDAAEHGPVSPRPERLSRAERQERQQQERSDYPSPSIEGGRRTARGELFRRPPQQPQPAPAVAQAQPLQPPSHEITLPLGNLLHLAYNPGYTGSDEARSELLQKLESESKAGGRARCWSCGALAIAYDRWNTHSKSFGEVGVAICEICGVWSVL